MIGRKYKLSLGMRISVLFIAVILLIVTLSGLVMYVEFRDIYRKQLTEDLNQITNQNRINLENLVSGIGQAVTSLYSDMYFAQLLTDPLTLEHDYLKLDENKKKLNQQFLKDIYVPLSNLIPSYHISFYADSSLPLAQIFSAGNLGLKGLYTDASIRSETWFQDTMADDGALHWFQMPDSDNRLYVAALIKNPYKYSLSYPYLSEKGSLARRTEISNLGVLVIDFDTVQIRDQLDASRLTPSTNLILLDQDDRILYGSDMMIARRLIDTHVGVLKEGKVSTANAENDLELDGERYMFSEHPMENGWTLLALIPKSDITKRMAFLQPIILTVVAASAVIGTVLSLFISHRVSRPIRKLALTMGGIHNTEHMQIHLRPKSTDEVGMLMLNFNRMMKRMNDLMNEVYNSGIKEKEAELKSLQAQINPHFLYNTLDSVNWMALEMGADRIAETISSLSNLLRYAIKDPSRLVTFQDEVSQVTDYLNVQKICYDHSFQVEFHIDPSITGVMVPKLLLQPLVENALQHGIEQTNGEGIISITAKVSGKDCTISVTNSGDGADAPAINAYLRAKETADYPSNGGLGIRNIDRRIQLLFGPEHGLHYENNELGGVTAIITLARYSGTAGSN